jgi:hypothetical protein
MVISGIQTKMNKHLDVEIMVISGIQTSHVLHTRNYVYHYQTCTNVQVLLIQVFQKLPDFLAHGRLLDVIFKLNVY